MCQLSFINLGSKKLNQIHLYSQFIVNTKTTHQDGHGFFQPGNEIYRTYLQPALTLNLGNWIRKLITTNDPVMAHVRLSSWGYKVLKDANSHPFEKESLILMHNGTLEFEDLKKEKEERFKDMIDSEKFATILDEIYSRNNDMSLALNQTMDLFTGKFAFIIYSKIEKRFYIIRGDTARLYMSNVFIHNEKEKENRGQYLGFVINTEDYHLTEALLRTSNQAQFLCGLRFEYDTKPIELPRETILAYNPTTFNLNDCGKLIEKRKPIPAVVTYPQNNYGGGKHNNPSNFTHTKTTVQTDFLGENTLLMACYKFMTEWNLTLPELDLLFYHSIGIPISGCKRIDVETFVNKVIPLLEKNATGEKNIRKVWTQLKDRTFADPITLTEKEKLKFPYFFNTVFELRECKRKYLKQGEIEIIEADYDDDSTIIM